MDVGHRPVSAGSVRSRWGYTRAVPTFDSFNHPEQILAGSLGTVHGSWRLPHINQHLIHFLMPGHALGIGEYPKNIIHTYVELAACRFVINTLHDA